MTDAEDRDLWEKRYGEAQPVWGWAPNRFVAEVLGPLPPGSSARLTPRRALDLAAGEGRNALWLADLGWRATAVDFAENALARAERAVRQVRQTDRAPQPAIDTLVVAHRG